MQEPAYELENVLRRTAEGSAKSVKETVDTYFTENATLSHPFIATVNGRDGVRAAYQILRTVTTVSNFDVDEIAFDAFEVQDDGSVNQAALLDMTQSIKPAYLPFASRWRPFHVRYLARVDLHQETDGLWKIYKQDYLVPTDLSVSGILSDIPPLNIVVTAVKELLGLSTFYTAALVNYLGIAK